MKQINRVSYRDLQRSPCPKIISNFLIGVIRNKHKISLNAFFKLLDLILADQGSRLLLEEQVNLYIFGVRKEADRDMNQLMFQNQSMFQTHLGELLEVLSEKDFKFIAPLEKRPEVTPSTAQTPLSIIGTSNIQLGETFMRSSSIVEIKVAFGQLITLLPSDAHFKKIFTTKITNINDHSNSDHLTETSKQFQQQFWLLLGVLSNFCSHPPTKEGFKKWDPVLTEKFETTITDRIQTLLTAYPNLMNSNNLHEKHSLFFVFNFLLAWTIFTEVVETVKGEEMNASGFWIKITPGILALVRSKVK